MPTVPVAVIRKRSVPAVPISTVLAVSLYRPVVTSPLRLGFVVPDAVPSVMLPDPTELVVVSNPAHAPLTYASTCGVGSALYRSMPPVVPGRLPAVPVGNSKLLCAPGAGTKIEDRARVLDHLFQSRPVRSRSTHRSARSPFRHRCQ